MAQQEEHLGSGPVKLFAVGRHNHSLMAAIGRCHDRDDPAFRSQNGADFAVLSAVARFFNLGEAIYRNLKPCENSQRVFNFDRRFVPIKARVPQRNLHEFSIGSPTFKEAGFPIHVCGMVVCQPTALAFDFWRGWGDASVYLPNVRPWVDPTVSGNAILMAEVTCTDISRR